MTISRENKSWTGKLVYYLSRRDAISPESYYVKNPLIKLLNKVFFNRLFMYFQSTVILTNLLLMAFLKGNEERPGYLKACTSIQLMLFFILLFQALGLGYETCIKDGSIIFRVFIAAACFVDCVLSGRAYSSYSTLTIFQILILLKEVFRFVAYSIALEFTRTLVPIMNYFFLMMLLIVLIFAQIGSQVLADVDLGNNFVGNLVTKPFSSFKDSTITSIEVVFGNNWSMIFYASLKSYGGKSFLYFFVVVIIGKQILMNIILAFLLQNMKELFERLHIKSKAKYVDKINRLKFSLNQYMANHKKLRLDQNQDLQADINTIKEEQELATIQESNQPSPGIKSLRPSSADKNSQKQRSAEFKEDEDFGQFSRFKSSLQDLSRSKNAAPKVDSLKDIGFGTSSLNNIGDLEQCLDTNGPEAHAAVLETAQDKDKRKKTSIRFPQDPLPQVRPQATPKKLWDRNSILRNKRTDSEYDSEPAQTDRPLIDSSMTIKKPQMPLLTKSEVAVQPLSTFSKINKQNQLTKSRTSYKKKATVKFPVMTIESKTDFGVIEVSSNTRCEWFRNSSLFIFHQKWKLRQNLIKLIEHNYFEIGLAFMILLSVILLGIASPLLDHNSWTHRIVRIIDIVITALFCLEFVLRSIAYGMVRSSLAKRKPYFCVIWNIIDFFVVVVSIWTYTSESQVSFFKSFKVLRLLRLLGPLRKIGRSMTLNLIVDTIFGSLFKMLVFTFFIFLAAHPYAFIGFDSHHEHFRACAYPRESRIEMLKPCGAGDTGHIVAAPNSFSTFLDSLLTSVVIMTGEGFKILFRFLVYMEGKFEASYLMIAQTFIGYYVMSLFLQNSFACVTILNYLEMKQTMEGTSNLNERERRIFEMQKQFIRRSLKPHTEKKKRGKFKAFITSVINHFWFDVASFVKLVMNIILLLLTANDEGVGPLKIVQIFMLGIYFVELCLKVYSLGFWEFWRDSFNKIDLVSTLGSGILLILYFEDLLEIYFMAPILLRIFTLGRFFRRLLQVESQYTKSAKSLLETLKLALLSLIPMFSIITLFISGFAIVGMFLFYGVRLQSEVNAVFNFQYFFSSFLTLLKLITGFNWNIMLSELSFNDSGCSIDQTASSILADGPNGCGKPTAYVFIFLYLITGKFLLMNLITVLVIDGYLESKKLEALKFNEEQVNKMYAFWAESDPARSGLMTCDNFILFLHQQAAPFGVLQGERIVKPEHITNKMIYRPDLQLVVTGMETLLASQQFPVHIYEIAGENYVHFVDYITFLTNKLNPSENHFK